MPVDLHGLAAQLRVGRGRPHVGLHAPLVGEQLLGLERPRHGHTRGQDLRPGAARARRHRVPVQAAQQALHVQVGRLGRLLVGLVVDGQVVEHVLGLLAVHAAQPVLDDVGHLVGPRRVVGDHGRVGVRQQQRVAVVVLQALTGQRGAAGRGAQDEAPGHLVGGGPQAVTGALEPEHRVEDVDRDHRLAVRGVGRADRGERGGGAGLVDALVQDLARVALLVGEHQLGVHGRVELALRVVDLLRGEHRVHAEGPGLVRDDRHDPLADLLVLGQVLDQPDERHGGGDLLLAGPAPDDVVDLVARQHQRLGLGPPLRQVAAELAAPLHQVADLRRVRPRVVVRRQVGVALQVGVGDRDAQGVPEQLQVVQGHLLHLVGGVAALEVRAEAVALDGVRQDHGGLTGGLHGRLVGRVHLAVVVAAPLEVPDLLVAQLGDQLLGARVAAEEVLPDVGAVVGLVGLVVTVRGDVHEVDQRAVAVGVQQRVPLPAPDHLDHVPAGAAEERLQLLDDLAVAADRAVQPLQVAVDHEGQVVQTLVGGHVHQTARLGLVQLAVPEEGPHPLVGGVLDAPGVQVAVEPGLVDGVHRAQAHGDRGKLPEVRHQPGVRVGRQTGAGPAVRVLLAEAVQVLGGQPALQERPGVDAGGGVALDVDLVAAARVVLAAEEPVEADLVEGGRGGVGGDVAADAHAGPLRAVHGHGRVPPDPGPVAALGLLVTGEPGLLLGGDRVDVVGAGQRRDADTALAGALQQAQHQVAGTLLAGALQHSIERLQPLGGLFRVDVRKVGREAVADDVHSSMGARAAVGVVLRGQGFSSPGLSSVLADQPRLLSGVTGTVGSRPSDAQPSYCPLIVAPGTRPRHRYR